MSILTYGTFRTETLGSTHASTTMQWILLPGTFIAIAIIVLVLVALHHHPADIHGGGPGPFNLSNPLHLIASAAGSQYTAGRRRVIATCAEWARRRSNILMGWVIKDLPVRRSNLKPSAETNYRGHGKFPLAARAQRSAVFIGIRLSRWTGGISRYYDRHLLPRPESSNAVSRDLRNPSSVCKMLCGFLLIATSHAWAFYPEVPPYEWPASPHLASVLCDLTPGIDLDPVGQPYRDGNWKSLDGRVFLRKIQQRPRYPKGCWRVMRMDSTTAGDLSL
ncbi:hypothetical protein FB451DRAFT_1191158 [Mycena latifolia]|nr:hypothetical protein FB451DRAFT_1191158 [Mycena latifolia]